MDGYIALWAVVRRSVVARALVLCALLAPPSVALLVLLDTMPNVIVPHVGNGLLECSQFLTCGVETIIRDGRLWDILP